MSLSILATDPAHFPAILAALPGNFMLLLPDAPTYTIVAISKGLLRQTEREADQVVGQSVFVAYPENPAEATNSGPLQMRTALDASLRNQQSHHLPLVRYDVPTAEGCFEERYWSGSSQAVLDAQGQVLYLLFTSVDMTAQLRAENEQRAVQQAAESAAREQAARAEVARQQAILARFLAQAPAAVCVYSGPDLVYEFVNVPYQELFGPRLLLGRPLAEALPEIVGQPAWQALRRVYETGIAHEEVAQLVPVARDHVEGIQDRYFTFRYQARTNEHGHVNGVLVFAFEVTEQVVAIQQVQRLNQALQGANRQLTRTNADLDNFIYTASHDLKAPIANIEGLVLALEDQLPAPVREQGEVQSILQLMQASVERFRNTINHLTDLSKLQQEHARLPEMVEVAAVVEDVRQDLQSELEKTGAQLRVDVGACPHVRFSVKNLRSVMYNLLSNALKYRAPDRVPVIDVSCATLNSGTQQLRVQDNGLGLASAQQQQLFRMFQRLHTHVEGTGIGLYMIKKMVENAGGTITVQSQLGVGSTFTVELPA